MSKLKNLIGKLTDNWTFEIRYVEGDVEKIYRSKAETASAAVVSFESSISVIPEAFILLTRDYVETNTWQT